MSPPQVYLDVKYASDPEIKLPIVILQGLQEPDEEHLLAYPPYGAEAYAGSHMPGGPGYPQYPMFTGPSAVPPTSETAMMYPPLTNFNEKS